MMTNGDPEGQIFLSHPHTNNGFFFLLTTKYLIFIVKHGKGLKKILNTRSCDMVTTRINVRAACGRHAAARFLSFPWAGTGV